MKIQYDKDFEKVMNELQANFGWSNIDELPDSYKDLLNDTIKAVKNCSIPDVVWQSKQLACPNCKGKNIEIRHREQSFRCIDCKEGWAN